MPSDSSSLLSLFSFTSNHFLHTTENAELEEQEVRNDAN